MALVTAVMVGSNLPQSGSWQCEQVGVWLQAHGSVLAKSDHERCWRTMLELEELLVVLTVMLESRHG